MRMTRTAVLLVGFAAAASVVAGGQAPASDRPKGRFTVGKDTTHATEPLDATGRVDYAAAINARLGKGVTPDTNAVVLLWKAMGPRPEGTAPMPPEFFRQLGVAPPPEAGDYFIDFPTFTKDRLKREPAADAAGRPGGATRHAWTADQDPDLAAWLTANEKPLALVVEATRRPHYFSPLIQDAANPGLLNVRLPGAQRARSLGSALAARAMLRAGRGDLDGAWADVLAGHRLGRLVGRGACLIEALVGVAINTIAAGGVPALLDRAGADAGRLARWARDLRELPPLPDVAAQVDLGGRYMLLDVMLLIDRRGFDVIGGRPGGDGPLADLTLDVIDWDPALRTANRWYDRLAAVLREKDRAGRVREYARFEADIKALKARASDKAAVSKAVIGAKDPGAAWGQAVGDILVSLMLPAAGKVQDAVDRAAQGQDNTAVAVALARHKTDRGGYPKELAELAPKYLARVPGDQFSGAPLLYRPGGGYVLYSVGMNGKDDGGRGYGDDPPADDLVIRMPPARP